MMNFNGPVFTVFTAFDGDYELDIPSTLEYVDFLINHGVKLIYVMPYNSRYLQLTGEEVSVLNTSVIKHVKSTSDAKVIVSAPVECSTRETLAFCREAVAAGVDCFASAFGEKFYSETQVVFHYELMANECKSILVHEQPLISGYDSKQMNWPTRLVEKVAHLDGVVGFKEDAKSFEFGASVLKRDLPVTMIFAGRKRLFAQLLDYGLRAYLNGISVVKPELAFTFWDLVKAGKNRDIEAFVSQVDDPFWDGPVKRYGWHRVNKASLECFGLMSRRDRMPLMHLDDEEYEHLRIFWEGHEEVICDWV